MTSLVVEEAGEPIESNRPSKPSFTVHCVNFLHKWFIFLHQKCLKFLKLQFNNFQIFEDRSAVGKFMHQLPWSELEVTRDVMFDEN
jgi:hypothetical protein